ncbi:MAG: hypothetical protein GX265_02345 [Mollicutes bacterium]|nr:hypothetical protein [Mollicutes bacterium]
MKIKSYKKIKGNEYELILDNDVKVRLYDDLIIKHELLLKKEITKDRLTKIVVANDNLHAYYLALKFLGKKMRSTMEIKNYLQKKEFDQKIIEETINKLIKENYLNNQKFMESYINDQFNLTYNGPEKIKQNLIKLGINEDQIVINKDFSEKIKTLISKKIKLNHKLSTNALKQNITTYLIGLGYRKEDFIDELDNIKSNDKSLIKKDYEKIMKKYQNKYDSFQLKMKVKEKLYQKGYTPDLINEWIEENL